MNSNYNILKLNDYKINNKINVLRLLNYFALVFKHNLIKKYVFFIYKKRFLKNKNY